MGDKIWSCAVSSGKEIFLSAEFFFHVGFMTWAVSGHIVTCDPRFSKINTEPLGEFAELPLYISKEKMSAQRDGVAVGHGADCTFTFSVTRKNEGENDCC